MKIKGIHHIELSISDLNRSKIFYQKLPGFKIVAEYPDFVMFFNGYFYLGLTTHKNQSQGVFDEKHIGMDHLSFEVELRENLDEAQVIFAKEKIPHGKIKKLSNGVFVIAFRDPDNIQLELSWKK